MRERQFYSERQSALPARESPNLDRAGYWVRGRSFNPGRAYFATITMAGRTRRSLSR